MKNRRIAIGAFFLAVILCLSVGYALVTDLLDIQGVANVAADTGTFDNGVYFDSAVAADANDTTTINADKDKATFTIHSLVSKGDTAEITFTIKNDNEVDALVTPKLSSNTNAEYFQVTSDWMVADVSQPKTIAAGSSETYTLTVELLKMPTAALGTSISVEMTATAE